MVFFRRLRLVVIGASTILTIAFEMCKQIWRNEQNNGAATVMEAMAVEAATDSGGGNNSSG